MMCDGKWPDGKPCGRQFSSEKDFRKHQKKCCQIITCGVCDRVYTTQWGYSQHKCVKTSRSLPPPTVAQPKDIASTFLEIMGIAESGLILPASDDPSARLEFLTQQNSQMQKLMVTAVAEISALKSGASFIFFFLFNSLTPPLY